MEILTKTIEDLTEYLPRMIGAVVVLVVGWLVALIVSAIVLRCLHRLKLDDRLASGTGARHNTERLISKAVYWLIMLFVAVAFFNTLNLLPVSDLLQNMLDGVLRFLPRLLAAGLLLAITWILATVLRLVLSKALEAARLDERLSKHSIADGQSQKSMSKTLADVVYWLVFLLFLPAILGALALDGILGPLQQMVAKIAAFLPNIVTAAVILLIGLFVAKIVRRIVANVLAAAGCDRVSEKVGMKGIVLSGVLGQVVYFLILIPVVIAALDVVQLQGVTQPISNMLEEILGAMPRVFSAILVLAIAYVLGRLIDRLAAGFLETIKFNSLPTKLGLSKEAKEGKWSPSEIVGHVILVAIMLSASVSALNLLHFDALADLFSQFLVFSGHIIVGLVIFGIGLYLANLASQIIKAGDTRQAGLLSALARIAILLLVGAIALRQMGLANEIINLAFGLVLGAVAVAGAIAFGVGGRDIAAQKLAEWTESIADEKPLKRKSESKQSNS